MGRAALSHREHPHPGSLTLRRIQALAAAALLLVNAGVATAGIPTDQIRASVDHVLAVLQDPALKPDAKAAERRAAIRHDADAVFDFTEMARRALGRHWQELNESQQQEFVRLFADLLERAYVSKIDHKGDRWLVYDVLVEGVSLVLTTGRSSTTSCRPLRTMSWSAG